MATSQPLPDRPGEVIGGRFVVEDALGRGGMAAVYRVNDLKTGEKLALKRSWAKDSLRSLKRRALLEREFHTLAQLSHPRIIEVYDYGVDEDGPYYTMELLDGADLDRAGPMPWQEACGLLRDIASSLAILHSRGLIHRDVSARNVRRTANGRAKLIDFGAMVSAGVANDVVGTPPFMAPEVLQMQSLDSRADLFSLGALAYYLLVGRHAFPARRTNELRDAWRSRPAAPSRVFTEVPAALSTLVLQLLSLDRGARPQSAAVVMEQLCAIASLPIEELPEITRAYLSTPTLVGRDKTLVSIRSHMLSLVRGDGGALLIEGIPGSGRSRMIDACVFEAKLLSALVVRAGAGDSGGAWGVARAIASQLFALLPDLAMDNTRLSRGVLMHVVDELRQESSNSVSVSFPERSLILRELRDFVLAMARSQRLLVAVDDADRIDEPSAAFLAALADKSDRRSLMLVLAVEPELATDAARSLSLVRSLAHRALLPALDAEQTEVLLRSVFGEVRNLGLWAARIHALAEGNPRTTMELAQQLVERRLARYEAGSWLLSSNRDQIELPKTLAESLASRLAQLTPDARELAEALAIADPQAFPLSAYRALTRHRDQKRMFAALEELVSARILSAGQDRYLFSQHGYPSVLLASMTQERRTAIHARLAEILAGGDVVQRAEHLMLAGRQREAVQLLCSIDLLARLPPLPLMERALEFAERDASLPARAVHRVRMAVLSKAALVCASVSFRRCLPPVLAQLERDSGLAAYRELTDVPADQRLAQALALQQQRYLAMDERDQVASVGDAMRELARLIGATCSMAVSTFDIELAESLPSLEPLLPLSPALRVIDQILSATRYWLSGRLRRAIEGYEQVLARLAEPDRAGMDEIQHQRTRLAIEYVLALIEATLGVDRVEQRAQRLESHRALRVNAWRIRMLLCLAHGDAQGAAKCSRRAELLMLQDDQHTHYAGTATGFQLNACYQAEDLLGVKAGVDALQLLADTHPGWRPMVLYAQSAYRHLQGDLPGALDALLLALELVQPGRHLTYGFIVSQHVKLLHALGRRDEALKHADQYIEIVAREQLTTAPRFLHTMVARLWADTGRHAEAVEMMDALLAQETSLGTSGLALGALFEHRARIALSMRDRAAFETYAERCAVEYKKGKNSLLHAKFARLIEHARTLDVSPAAALEKLLSFEIEQVHNEDDGTVRARLDECVDAADRARSALTLLLQSTDSYLGHLFGVAEARLEPLAALPEVGAETELLAWIDTWVKNERELAVAAANATTTVSEPPTATESYPPGETTASTEGECGSVPPIYTDSQDRRFRAVGLIDSRHAVRRLVAVFVHQVQDELRRRPTPSLLAQIAAQLADHGDAIGVALDLPARGSLTDAPDTTDMFDR
jgi:tRNA A-37 threonylcarbamoyl transferase component Bud32/tetratricopeptide (TPR) repeat protein